MVQVKFCGLTTATDYITTWKLGAEYAGFVCYAKSPRATTPTQVATVIEQAHHEVDLSHSNIPYTPPKRVGLCVDMDLDAIMTAQKIAQFDIIQLYNTQVAHRLKIPHWIVKRIRSRDDIIALQDTLMHIDNKYTQGIVLDSFHTAEYGGTGKTFRWEWLSELNISIPYFIAGGINKDNISSLLMYNPYGVDMSSGIETVKGIKDYQLMDTMMSLIRR